MPSVPTNLSSPEFSEYDREAQEPEQHFHLFTLTKGSLLPESSQHVASLSKADKEARSLQLAVAAARTADENRGRDIVVLDVRQLTCIFDYFVIATGTSRRHLHAISEEIDHTLEDELGDERMGIEGYTESRWVLLDYGTVVIHLFETDTRDFYGLENLWSDAERVELPWPSADARDATNA